MSKLFIIILSMFSAAAFARMPSGLQSEQVNDREPLLIAMGPDPGGIPEPASRRRRRKRVAPK